jgi:hypothetical protein
MRAAFVLIALVSVALPRAAAAAPTATMTGRIVFRDANRTATPAEVERLRWGHIILELRHDHEVFAVRPDGNGVFNVTGPPGRYVIEYVRLGELAEFFVPHEVDVRPGDVTCLGTLEVVVQDLAKDLGNNSSGELNIVDDCADIRSNAGGASAPAGEVAKSLARPAPRAGQTLSLLDVLLAFRAEADLSSGGLSSARGAFVLPLGKESDVLVAASVMNVGASFVNERWPASAVGGPAAKTAWGGTVGAGYNLWILEGLVYGGFLGDTGRGGHGSLAGFSLRLGTFLFGIGGRLDFYGTGDHVGAFTIDLSPVGLLGSLL